MNSEYKVHENGSRLHQENQNRPIVHGNKSRIDPRCTIDPWTQQEICGSWKAGKKEEFINRRLTIEDLLADQELFNDFICHRPPLVKDSWSNGRCAKHGGRGGAPPKTGKYSRYIKQLDPIEAAQFTGRENHKTLDPELAVISKFIGDKLGIAMGDHATEANQELRRKIKALETALQKLDVRRMEEIMRSILDDCDNRVTVEAAKKDVEQLIKVYSQVFETELKSRALLGEYIHKADQVQRETCIFNICVAYITDNEAKEKCRRELYQFVTGGFRPSLPINTIEIGDNGRFENPNQEATKDYIDTEYSSETVSD